VEDTKEVVVVMIGDVVLVVALIEVVTAGCTVVVLVG
jgi:hypothetical protein